MQALWGLPPRFQRKAKKVCVTESEFLIMYGSEAKADINPQHDRHAKNIKLSLKSPKNMPNMPKRNAVRGLRGMASEALEVYN